MELTYYGAGCVLITTKQGRVLVDPPDPSMGWQLPKLKPEITLWTIQQPDGFHHKDGFAVASPGEYEIKGIEVQAIAAQLHADEPKSPRRGLMYVIEAGGVRLLVTGNITADLDSNQTEAAGEVDALVVPVGGHGLTLDASGAAKVVSHFEPSFVIPVHYDDGKTKYAVPQDGLAEFLKEVGGEGSKPVDRLKLAAADSSEDTTVVILEVQN
ncbi:MBL fold metallo-hydrolase [Candidatus Microgenomates bacterium]|nr:MBL fold metallo-hydrolase [Candidatus Microgenomates bacterium]